MPSTDQACVPVPVLIDQASWQASWGGSRSRCHAARAVRGGFGRSISAPLSPARLPGCGLQKYDSRTACLHGSAPPASGPSEHRKARSRARASRLTADQRHRRRAPLPGTLTPKVVQNNSSIDGFGFHRVNFAPAAFSSEHFLIRPGVRTSKSGRRTKMTDLIANGDLFVDGFALNPPLSRRNRTAPLSARTPQFSCPTNSRRALRGRKE